MMGSTARRLTSTGGALFLLFGGCLPYRELYRPQMRGTVVDSAGVPQSQARVESCSAARGAGLRTGCPRQFVTFTDSAGRFDIPERREWEWCCLGDAPFPKTEVRACTRDGLAAVAAPRSDGSPLVLQLLKASAAPEDLRERCASWILSEPAPR